MILTIQHLTLNQLFSNRGKNKSLSPRELLQTTLPTPASDSVKSSHNVGRQARGGSKNKDMCLLDFPGGPVVKTLSFHCRGLRLDSWSEKFCMPQGVVKKKKSYLL